MADRVMVIGAGGYVGRHVVKTLQRAGCEVSSVSTRTPGGMDARRGLLPGEFNVPRGTCAVIYLSQSPFLRAGSCDPVHGLNVQVISAVRAAMAAERGNVSRFLYASTGSVYRPALEPLAENAPVRADDWYGLSKLHGEQALRLLDDRIRVHVARIFTVYGPSQTERLVPRLIQRLREGGEITLEPRRDGTIDGGLRLSLAYVEDVADILAQLALEGGPPVLNVAGRDALSIREICEMAAKTLRVTPRFVVGEHPREGDLVADISLLERSLAPKLTPFDSGLARMLAVPG